MNMILEKLNYPYVLELASGMTPREIDLADKTKIIETDLKDMVKIKKDIVNEIDFDGNFKMYPLNVINNKEFMALGKLFDNKKPIAIIHSGLWTYLNKDEQKKLTQNIKGFLKRYSKRGYWITSDVRPRSEFKNNFFRFFRRGITKKTGRAPTRFDSDKELIDYMKKAGFKVKVIDVLNEIYNKMYLPKIFNLKKEDVSAQSQGMKVYIMRLK